MNIENFATVLKALAHPIRLKIACGLLKKSECNVNTMCEKLQVSQPTVSQHLTILKNAGVIVGVRNGNRICYKIENPEIKKIIQSFEIEMCD